VNKYALVKLEHSVTASQAGSKNSLEPTTAPVVTNGADDLEAQLARILARVPPIITPPRPKERCPYTEQSRTSLLELVSPCARNNFKPPVRAIYRRSHKHAVRGRWLIPAENLFRYLLGLSDDSTEAYLKLAAERKQKRGEAP
jgi:hypothetical protein